MRGRALRWVLAAALLAMPALAAAPQADPPIPFPDLSSLDREVAEQLAAGRERLAAQLAAAAPDAQALAGAYGDLGLLYHAYSLGEPAEACYRNAARLAPEDYRWAHALGVLRQETGRVEQAAEALQRALALAPGDAAALVYLAEMARSQGRTADAEALARRALAADPACTAARALLGQTALDRGDFGEAVKLLEAALAEVPSASRLHYLLARAWRGLGDAAKAQEHLGLAGPVGVRPADPLLAELDAVRSGEKAHLIRGKVAYNAGRFAEAAEEYRRALAVRPESVEAHVNLAAALVQLGDRAEAVAELRQALRGDPSNATAHFNLGMLLSLDGPSEEARAHLAAAVAALPRDAEAHRALAQVLRDGGRLEEALAEYAQAVQLNQADEIARLGEAETLVRLQRYAEARRRLEEGLRAMPQSGLLTHGLARLLAACPDPALRDGARAVGLAFAVWQVQPSAVHAETVALANAEKGDCAEAARWQRIALDAGRDGPADLTARLQKALAAYDKGAPCRPGP